ncbi:MAG TPA: AlpA family transcriptional regulator [Fibrobacteria bacterium]|nr:AlpA family transcriptional regulator [Fibrobacteria bacterium]
MLTTTFPPLSRLLRRPEVCALTGLPKSTLYDYLAAGTFPAPVKLSARSVAWKLEDVRAWIESRVSSRPALAGKGA